MNANEHVVEHKFFQLKTGVDTLNYIIIADTIHVAGHESILPFQASFVERFQTLVRDYTVGCDTMGRVDSDEYRKLNLKYIGLLDDFLRQVEEAGLWLVIRMWSVVPEDDLVPSEEVLNEVSSRQIGFESVVDEEPLDKELGGYDAFVYFVLVPNSCPSIVPDGNGHREVYVRDVPVIEDGGLLG